MMNLNLKTVEGALNADILLEGKLFDKDGDLFDTEDPKKKMKDIDYILGFDLIDMMYGI